MTNLKITKIETIPYRLPVRREFRWASLQDYVGGFVCVRIETNKDIVGFGEATPLPDWGGDYGRKGGETLNTVQEIINNVLKPLLIGKDPTEIAHIHQEMDKYVQGNTYAKCAIDIALYDILGKLTGLPIYKLLGGKVRESLPVNHMLGIMSIEETMEEAKGAYKDGIRAFQIKAGENYQRDIAVVKMLKEEFGEKIWLRLDPNKRYKDVKTTMHILNEMKIDGKDALDMIEQPIEGLRNMSVLTDKIDMKTIIDESCWNLTDAYDAIRLRASDAISIYLAKAGGIYQASKIAMLADAFNIPCDVNGSLESAIGTAANVHFGLSHPAVTIPSTISINAPEGKNIYEYGGRFYTDDICVDALPVKDGALLPLNNPGLGIEIDMEKLDKYRIK